MTFIEYIKKNLNIAALIVLLGFAGNVLAYVYKAAYFFYFHIPASMISFAFYEVVLFSVTPIVLGLLYVYALWITEAPENELAKLKAKYHLRKRIRPVNRFIVILGCLLISFVQWYITKNIILILLTFLWGATIFVIISFLIRDNFKPSRNPAVEKKSQRENRRFNKEAKAYWTERVNKMKDGQITEEEMKQIALEEIAASEKDFNRFTDDLKQKAASLRIIFGLIIAISVLMSAAAFGWTSARFKAEYPIVIYQNEGYVCVAEYDNQFICTRYGDTKKIVPGYQLIPFTEAEVVMLRRIGPLSINRMK